jgi:hypothetical protein
MGRSGVLRRSRRVTLGVALGIVVFGLVAPAVLATPASASTHPGRSAPPIFGVSAEKVTWNGVDVANHTSPSSAFVVTTGSTVLVNFSFFGSLSGANITAELQVIYFGTAISTNSVATSTSPLGPGKGLMNWSFGDYTELLEGVYQFTASLVNSSSSATIWSESFYVDEQAPYRLVSGFQIFLIALAASEIYTLATTRRRVRRQRGKSPPAQWQGPASTTSPPTDSATPPSDDSPPPMPTPPPSGGSP